MKRFHVGYFINKYMNVLEINSNQLSIASSVSKVQIKNIINGINGISPEIAIKIAPVLHVSPDLLLNLHTLWLNNKNIKEVLETYKAALNSITPEFKEKLYKLNISIMKLENFKAKSNNYASIYKINYYMPKKANVVKEYILIEYFNMLETTENNFDSIKFNNFLLGEYADIVANINVKNYKENLQNLLDIFNKMGINIKIINSGLKTTTKGLSKNVNGKAVIMVEDTNDIANELWYLTHELVHLANPQIVDDENLINNITGRILLKNIYSNIDKLSYENIYDNRKTLIENGINPYAALAVKQFFGKYRGVPLEKMNENYVIKKRSE